MVYSSGNVIDSGSNKDSRDRVDGRKECGESMEPVLVSPSNLYSLLNSILVDASKFSSCFTLYHLLTTCLLLY